MKARAEETAATGNDRGSNVAQRLAISACLIAATIAAYASVSGHDFVNYDDLHLVVNNPNLTRPVDFDALLSHFAPPQAANSNWLPLYWMSLQLGFAVHGPDAGAFLLTNVLIHSIAAALLFHALFGLTGSTWRSAFVAAVFALHPLHVESVAWVTQRKDVLAGFFFMLGLIAYGRYVQMPASAARYGAVVLCLTLGLMSKSTLVTFPAVLLLIDAWPLDRLRRAPARAALEKLPMFGLVALASATTVFSQRGRGNIELGEMIGIGSRIANAIESVWHYLVSAVWPSRLGPLYPHPYLHDPVSSSGAIAAALLGVALLAVTALAVAAFRKRPYLGVGWLWFLGTLIPVIGLVQVGLQSRADRYMYLPLVGLSLAVAWGAGEFITPSRRKAAAAITAAILVGMTIVTHRQVDHWRNSIALFERAVDVTERNRYAHERLGYELLEAGRPEEARDHYRAAIRIAPERGALYYGLALAFEAMGDRDAAIAAHRSGLRHSPDMALGHGALGILLLEDGRLIDARRHLRHATRDVPESSEYREALAEVTRRLDATEGDAIHPPGARR